jgi:hypothetical protein
VQRGDALPERLVVRLYLKGLKSRKHKTACHTLAVSVASHGDLGPRIELKANGKPVALDDARLRVVGKPEVGLN